MSFRYIGILVTVMTLNCGFVHAQGPTGCAVGKLELVYQRAKLPPPVQRMLLKEGATADRGEDFSNSDQGDLPRRRFGLGAIAAKKVFVAVEYGGIASGVDWTVFRLAGDQWIDEGSQPIARIPASESEIRWVICNGNLPPVPPADQQNRVRKM